ncbi:MAG: hypothetical protein JNL74_14275 [Fibrobacteres bacterium]|nr:hypothetical protein [Fibrobacterota bacterium]
MRISILATLLSLAALVNASTLVSGPTLTYRSTDKSWLIDFTVSDSTDVSVEALKRGLVVAHIASGVLGANAPLPLTPNSLHQAIVWDGKDDFGKTITDTTGLAFRVRLNMSVIFDKYVNRQDRRIPSITSWGIGGMVVDSNRNLYVIATPDMEKGRTSGRLFVYSSTGEYVKTLLPFAADADPSKLEGVVFNPDEGRGLNPTMHGQIQEGIMPNLLSVRSMTIDMNRAGQIIIASGFAGKYTDFRSRYISFVNKDGEIKSGPLFLRGGDLQFAFTPEGDSFFISSFGQFTRYYNSYNSDSNCVYKCGMSVSSQPILFSGERGVAGSDSSHFKRPWGIASDAAGNVYVADHNNCRIKKLNRSGKCIGILKVIGKPMVLKVHPVTGHIYTTQLDTITGSIFVRKYTDIDATAPSITLSLGQSTTWASTTSGLNVTSHKAIVMALDHYGDSAVVYVGASMPGIVQWNVMRLADAGTSFISTYPKDLAPTNPGALSLMTVDQKNDVVYLTEKKNGEGNVASWSYNGETGALSSWWADDNTMKLFCAPSGLFYQPSFSMRDPSFYQKKNAAGTAIMFANGTNKSQLGKCWGDRFTMKSNLSINYDGSVLALEHLNRVGDTCQVVKYDSAGVRDSTPLLKGFPNTICVKSDRKGNVFVAANLKPQGKIYPDYLSSATFMNSTPRASTVAGTYGNLLGAAYGSVLKFGPNGGAVRKISNTSAPLTSEEIRMDAYLGRTGNTMYDNDRFAVSGLQKSFLGMSPVLPNRYTYAGASDCNCFNPVFDVDAHGRLFVPDAVRHCVYVLDNNMNVITMFGSYDNFDNQGGTAVANRPSIPLEYPHDVHCTDKAIYVGNYGTRYYGDWTHSSSVLRTVPVYEKEYIVGDSTGVVSGIAKNNMLDKSQFSLQASPNPFNPRVNIDVRLPGVLKGQQWKLALYDVGGKLVKIIGSGKVSAVGVEASFSWDGSDMNGHALSSGQFMARISCGTYQQKKMIVKIK